MIAGSEVSKKLKWLALSGVVAIGLGVGQASAASVDFDVYKNPSGADTSGFSPTVELTDNGNSITFDFSYAGPGSLRAIAFESGVANLFKANNSGVGNSVSRNDNPGLWFSRSSSFSLWDGDSVDWQGESMAVLSSNADMGVNALGEKLSITLEKLNSGTSVSDVLAMLGTMGSRMGLMVESYNGGVSLGAISGGGSQTGDIAAPVHAPTPAAFATGLALLGGMTLRRTRRE